MRGKQKHIHPKELSCIQLEMNDIIAVFKKNVSVRYTCKISKTNTRLVFALKYSREARSEGGKDEMRPQNGSSY